MGPEAVRCAQVSSAVIFCHTEGQSVSKTLAADGNQHSRSRRVSEGMRWKVAPAVDDQFAAWAKDPRAAKRFHVEVCWAEAISESVGRQRSSLSDRSTENGVDRQCAKSYR